MNKIAKFGFNRKIPILFFISILLNAFYLPGTVGKNRNRLIAKI